MVTGGIAALIYLAGDLTLRVFLPAASEAMPIARHINHEVLWSLALFSITFALSGIVRSTGAVIPPLAILIVSMWVIRVPFAKLLIPHWGADAIWWSFPLGTITSSVLTALYYRFGGWRSLRMLKMVSEPGGQTAITGLGAPTMDIPIEDEEAEEAVEAAQLAAKLAHTPAA